MNSFLSNAVVIAVATATYIASPPPASAALVLQLESGGVKETIYDGGANDGEGLAGLVGYSGVIGGWKLNLSTGFGNSLSSFFGVHLNSVNMSSSGSSPLTVRMTETNLRYGLPDGAFLPISGAIGGVSGGDIDFALFADDGNAEFGKSSKLWAESATKGAFSATGGSYMVTSDPFSLTLEVTMDHHSSAKITSFDFEGRVPEPATLALFGLALIGLGFSTRKRWA